MRESCCAAEGKFEGLFKEEATEDHEVVPVAVLGLHYLRGIYAGRGHVENVLGFTGREVRVCVKLSQRVHWRGVVEAKADRDIRAV